MIAEAAGALSSAHAAGVAHMCLSPGSVRWSPTGEVKVVGLGIDAALSGIVADEPVRCDTEGLGWLLYAALTGYWPGPEYPRYAAGPDGRRRAPQPAAGHGRHPAHPVGYHQPRYAPEFRGRAPPRVSRGPAPGPCSPHCRRHRCSRPPSRRIDVARRNGPARTAGSAETTPGRRAGPVERATRTPTGRPTASATPSRSRAAGAGPSPRVARRMPDCLRCCLRGSPGAF